MKKAKEHLMKIAFRVGFSDIVNDKQKSEETMKSLNIVSEEIDKLYDVIDILKREFGISAMGNTLLIAKRTTTQISEKEHKLVEEIFGGE
jgi:hypothetical protein